MDMIFPWIMAIASIVGVVANIYKKEWCFVLWIFTNGFWCIYDLQCGLYHQSALFLLYFILAFWGLIKWAKDKVVKNER